jgi:ferric iron reductase protein FhuF
MNPVLNQLLTEMRERHDLHLPITLGALGSEHQASVTVQDLLEGDTLLDHIRRLAAHKQTDDLQAAGSLFQKRISSVLLGSVLTPMTRAGVGLIPDPMTTRIHLEDHHPAGVHLDGEHTPVICSDRMGMLYTDYHDVGWKTFASEDALRQTVFQKLFVETLAPLSLRVAEVTGLSLRILWGNIGNYIAYFFDQLRKDDVLAEPAARDEAALMSDVGYDICPIEKTSQLYFIEEATPPQWVRIRSTCCLWCHLSTGSYCVTCPRLTREQRVEKLNDISKSKS